MSSVCLIHKIAFKTLSESERGGAQNEYMIFCHFCKFETYSSYPQLNNLTMIKMFCFPYFYNLHKTVGEHQCNLSSILPGKDACACVPVNE